jgi:hypothetical protein
MKGMPRVVVVVLALVALGGGKKEESAAPDPNTAAAKAHGGKVWVQAEPIATESGNALLQWLGSHPAKQTIAQKSKDGPWSIQYLAVFKKPAAKGPMTVQFVDKNDPKDVVDQYSPSNDASALVFRSSFDLDPDRGFNKGHTYLVKVGQLIKKSFVVYATGEVTLK